jgi:hypothetical protein
VLDDIAARGPLRLQGRAPGCVRADRRKEGRRGWSIAVGAVQRVM